MKVVYVSVAIDDDVINSANTYIIFLVLDEDM